MVTWGARDGRELGAKDTKHWAGGLREGEEVVGVLLCLRMATWDRYNAVVEVHALSC